MPPLDVRDYPPFREHFMWRESDDGTLTCTCPACGWSRHLNANAQGLASPMHVLMHMRKCAAPVTGGERGAG